MAKMKSFAVEVEIVSRVMVFVEARKPGGAEEKVQTEEGWSEATRWFEPSEGVPSRFDPKTMKVLSVREAGL